MMGGFRTTLGLALACASTTVALAGGGGGSKAKPAPAPPPAPAAGDRPVDVGQLMNLADVLAVAIRQAPDLEHAAIDTRTFTAFARRALGPEDTKIAASGTISDDALGKSRAGDLSITRLLPGGTLLSVSTSLSRLVLPSDPSAPPAVADMPVYAADAKVSITQPLLRGFGLVASNVTKYVSRSNRSANQLREMQRACEMVSSVIQQYWQLALAWRQLEIRRNAVDLAKKQLEYTEASIRTGKIAGAEAIPVKEAIAVREQDVLAAEVEVWQQSMELRTLVGMEIGPDVQPLATDDLPEVDAIELDQHALVAQALESNYAVKASTVGLGAFRAAVTGAKSQVLPKLDAHFEGGPVGSSTTKLKDAYSNMIHGGNYDYLASLDFEWNIDADGPRAQVQVEKQNLLGAETDLEQLRLNVAGNTALLVKQAEANTKAAVLGKEAIELAQDNVEAEQKKLEAGKSSNNEVLRRQDELLLARLRYAVTLAQAQSTRAELEVQTGTILDTHGISYHWAK